MEKPLDGTVSQARRGHLFLWVVDMRRAVIGINFAQVLLGCLSIVANKVMIRSMEARDKDVYKEIAQNVRGYIKWQILVVLIHGTAAVGAYYYNKFAAGLQTLHGVYNVGAIVVGEIDWLIHTQFTHGYWFYMIFTLVKSVVFSVYPNAVFAYQVHKGIMSKETYHRERYSICCLGNEHGSNVSMSKPAPNAAEHHQVV